LRGIKALGRGAALGAIGVRADKARINGKAIAADEAPLDAAVQHHLKHVAQQATIAETAVPIFRKRRMVWDRVGQSQPAKPPIGEIEVDLLAQATFGADAETIS